MRAQAARISSHRRKDGDVAHWALGSRNRGGHGPAGGSPTGRPTGPILFKGNTAQTL
jgi:hypothetical protein